MADLLIVLLAEALHGRTNGAMGKEMRLVQAISLR